MSGSATSGSICADRQARRFFPMSAFPRRSKLIYEVTTLFEVRANLSAR